MSTSSTPGIPRPGRGRPRKDFPKPPPIVTVEPYEGVPEGIARLDALRPGQTMRLYRGSPDDFDNKNSPRHSAILLRVFAHAKRLEERGKLALMEQPFEIAPGVKLIDYIAKAL